MFQVVLVAPVVVLFQVLGTFALVLHKFPFVNLMRACRPSGFDDALSEAQAYSFICSGPVRPSMSFAE